jgi:hypothetical protein
LPTIEGAERRHHPESGLYNRPEEKLVSFRMLTHHQAEIDAVVTRLDVLVNGTASPGGEHWVVGMGGEQFGTTLASGKSHLWIPPLQKGVLGVYGALFSAKELSEAFRALADVIDKHSG